MHPCPIPFAIGASLSTAKALVPAVEGGTADLATALELSRAMRIAATGKLLLSGRPREFFGDLQRSAQAFAHWTRGVTHAPATGRATPFFDACACGDLAAIRQIAAATARQWSRGQEYEDDFLYLRFLMDLVAGDAAPDPGWLTRFTAIAVAPEPRLACCHALQDRDATALAAALRELVARDTEALDELAAEDRLDPDEAATTAMVSIEGLALVQIAARLGVTCPDELPRIPSLARRVDLHQPLAAAAWREVEVLGIVA